MKFSMPLLVTAMAVRAVDAEVLARTAREEGIPVCSATIRKAMKGQPVNLITATRIASVIRTIPVLPEMTEVIGNDPAQPKASGWAGVGGAREPRRAVSKPWPGRPGGDPALVAREIVEKAVDWKELARILSRFGGTDARTGMISGNIQSADNRFQHLLVLKENRNKRHRYHECFIEGVRPIKEALRHGWTLSAVVREAGRPISGWAEEVCGSPQVEQVLTVSPALMRQLADRAEGSEVLATARIKDTSLDEIHAAPDLLVVVLDKPSSPGNLGTTIRSAHSFGATAVVICGHAADVWDPVCMRASVGTVFSLQPTIVDSSKTIAAWLAKVRKAIPIQVVGTDSKGSANLSSINLVLPTMLLIGNEASGLSPSFRALADAVAAIPMVDEANSLNAAVAASVALYEARRQRAG